MMEKVITAERRRFFGRESQRRKRLKTLTRRCGD